MAHSDLDLLLGALLPFAQQSLAKHGEFYPFGGVMGADGDCRLAAASMDDNQPESSDVISRLVEIMRQQASAGEIRAAAIAFDGLVLPPGASGKSDAICVRLEHTNGEAVEVFQPYKKGLLGRFKYAEIFAEPGERSIFV